MVIFIPVSLQIDYGFSWIKEIERDLVLISERRGKCYSLEEKWQKKFSYREK